MKNKLIYLGIIFIFFSCNKYEEGPSFSLRSAEKRLCGQWRLNKLLYNDKDITVAYYSAQLDLYPYNIYSDWSDKLYISVTNPDGKLMAQSPLTLNKTKNIMTFCLLPVSPYENECREIFSIIPLLSGNYDWKILKLKNNEFIIKSVFVSNNFEIQFSLLNDLNDY